MCCLRKTKFDTRRTAETTTKFLNNGLTCMCFTALLHLSHKQLAIGLNLEGKSCDLNNQWTVHHGVMASRMLKIQYPEEIIASQRVSSWKFYTAVMVLFAVASFQHSSKSMGRLNMMDVSRERITTALEHSKRNSAGQRFVLKWGLQNIHVPVAEKKKKERKEIPGWGVYTVRRSEIYRGLVSQIRCDR